MTDADDLKALGFRPAKTSAPEKHRRKISREDAGMPAATRAVLSPSEKPKRSTEQLVGYVDSTNTKLTEFDGKTVITGLKMISKFKVPPFRPGDFLYSYRAHHNGRTYSGQGQGPMMILKMRSTK